MAIPLKTAGEFRLVVTGGGTGGHVYPALAVVDYLRRRHPRLRCTWVGSERMESKIVPSHGIDFHQIDIRFSYRPLNFRNLGYYATHVLPILYGKPFRQARYAMESLRPQFVLATGGYVSAPVLLAAQRAGIPYALLQIDARPGQVNWFFADQAWRVYAATARAAQALCGRCSDGKVQVTGCPATLPSRTPSSVYGDLGIERRRRLLLAMGGSLGAAAIDRVVWEVIEAAEQSRDKRWKDLAVVHVIGRRARAPEVPAGANRGRTVLYKPVDYLQDVPSVLAAAGFYLGRSGAATVGEITAAGLPALLIPDPQHSDKQQLANAEELERIGLGTILDQDSARGRDVLDWIARNWDAPRRPAPEPPAALIGEDILQIVDGG